MFINEVFNLYFYLVLNDLEIYNYYLLYLLTETCLSFQNVYDVSAETPFLFCSICL